MRGALENGKGLLVSLPRALFKKEEREKRRGGEFRDPEGKQNLKL